MIGRPRNGTTSACQTCGAAVYTYPSQKLRLFCGIPCRTIAKRREVWNDEAQTKKCARCNEWRPFSSFWPTSGTKAAAGALQAYCISCIRVPEKPDPRPDLPKDKRLRKNARAREYRQANKDKVRLWNKCRVHRQRAAGVAPGPYDIGFMLCDQDYRCPYCSGFLDKYHIEHKVPISRGGDNSPENVHMVCPTCNLQKGRRTHEEFLAVLRKAGL